MNSEYIPLKDTPSDEEQEFIPATRESGLSAPPRYSGLMSFGALTILFLCTLANTLHLTFHENVPAPIPTRQPSTYMGLSPEGPSSEESFTLFPVVLTQIDSSSKAHIFKEDVKQTSSAFGTVWPDIRHFQLRSTISSVAQFRPVDYGYESCALTFMLNPEAAHGGDVQSLPSLPHPVDVYIHHGAGPIAPGSLSYNKLYGRRGSNRRLLETIAVLPNTTTKGESFPCASGSLITLEVSCRAPPQRDQCDIDFWHDPRNNKFGFMITQSKGFIPVS
ncbi:hypothetical protein DFP72DRAFT_243079 [Ephemerocybe angulata]|uniref:Ubiquitin 3 binding protein But2 C-terminal domain-containing protein n=1 Tax=Ephemerocybe angulata TaxID=980116 RepID=A0A8H6LTH8_9AGAR|nr:hypothetical protein DFP72DRAFT_243079 [Tulosesus angulatus]